MSILELMSEMEKKNQPFAVATVVKTSGSVPGKVGFKILVDAAGKSTGTVGGGELEQRVTTECISRLKEGNSGVQEYILREKPGDDAQVGEAQIVPMMCNGRVLIYYEVFRNRTPVYIFGGGHVGQALSAILAKLGYHLILIDNREDFVTGETNPHFHEKHLAQYPDYAREFSPPPDSFVVIMTQGHGYDYETLREIWKRNLPLKYIGVIASKSKSAGLMKNLQRDFGGEIDFSRLYSPIGLDIGGSTENEIALSIAAEIQAVRYDKNLPHLRKGKIES